MAKTDPRDEKDPKYWPGTTVPKSIPLNNGQYTMRPATPEVFEDQRRKQNGGG